MCEHTYLEDMFKRIGNLLPLIDDVLVPLAHDKVKVLILLSRDYAVMVHPLLIVRQRTPAIAMQCIQEREACPIDARVKIDRSLRKRHDF